MNKALIAIDRSKSFRVYLTISTDLVPVSYTHLDVYKRQVERLL